MENSRAWAGLVVAALLAGTACTQGNRTYAAREASDEEVATVTNALVPAPGNQLARVLLPSNARCTAVTGSNVGTSVALLPGGLLSPEFEQAHPYSLVTSCWDPTGASGNAAKLFLTDLAGVPLNSTGTPTDLSTAALSVTVQSISSGHPIPPQGFGAFALRTDKGDLIACGNTSGGTTPLHPVFKIQPRADTNPANAAPTWDATWLFDSVPDPLAAGEGICDGIAWDPANDTIWISPDDADSIRRFQNGTPTGADVNVHCPGFGNGNHFEQHNSGIFVSGDTIFAGCDGGDQIQMLSRSTCTGTPQECTVALTITTDPGALRTEDLECDPVTFNRLLGAVDGTDGIWSKDAFGDELFAFAVPRGSCGLAGNPPGGSSSAPGCPTNPTATTNDVTVDTDGDGLPDCWEASIASGINAGKGGPDIDGNGTVDLDLQNIDFNGSGLVQTAERPSVSVRDVYVEIDWLDQHEPKNGAIDNVIAAFAAAPSPIQLHVLKENRMLGSGTAGVLLRTGSVISHSDGVTDTSADGCNAGTDTSGILGTKCLAFTPSTPESTGTQLDFDALKSENFGTAVERASGSAATLLRAKKAVFHYAIWGHSLVPPAPPREPNPSGTAEIAGNDFVVTLGQLNHFPLSNLQTEAKTFMHELGHNLGLRHGGGDNINQKPNYLSVMNYTFQPNLPSFLNYSTAAFGTVSEGSLNETGGLNALAGLAGRQTISYLGSVALFRLRDIPAAVNDIDWNGNGQTPGVDFTAEGAISAVDVNADGSSTTVMPGFNDWGGLQLPFRNSLDFGDGVHVTAPAVLDLSVAEMKTRSRDGDGDGVSDVADNCPLVANASQADTNQDGIGDACQPTPTLACVDKHQTNFVAHFGYVNNNVPLSIPVGPTNQFTPAPADRGQPTAFQTGTFPDVFTPSFTSGTITWTLAGLNVAASSTSTRCASSGQVLGCEDSTLWSRVQGTVTIGNSATHSEGTSSLSLTGSGNFEVISRVIATPVVVRNTITYDVRLPATVPWGFSQILLTAPSRNVFHEFVGQATLIGVPAGQFRQMSISIPTALRTKLGGAGVTDLQVTIVFNVPTNQAYLVDNIRFP